MPLPTPAELRDEMKVLVRRAAEPARSGESVKAEIGRAARVLGLTYSRVKRYWYGEIQVPPAHEVDAIRAAMAVQPAPRAEPAHLAAGLHVVYDENGRIWTANSPELKETLGYTVGDFDVAGFAVRCLGWVEVRHSPGRLHLRIAPRVAQPKAVDALCHVLALAGQVDVALTVRDGQSWQEEAIATPAAALERIEALARGPEATTGRRFLSAPQPMSVLFRDKQRYLLNMLQEARSLLGGTDVATAVRFAAADATGRTSVAIGTPGRSGGRPLWAWQHIGTALRFYTPEERARLIGADIRKAPDAEYGEWCAEAYDRVVAGGEPLIEDVRALVLRKSAAPVESRYRRMLVPVTSVGGQSIVLVTSDFKPLQRAA